MSNLVYIAIGIITIIIIAKNWDKIVPLLAKRQVQKPQSIEINKGDLKQMKQEKLQYLYNQRKLIEEEIEKETHNLKLKLKEVNMEIYLLQDDKIGTPKWKSSI